MRQVRAVNGRSPLPSDIGVDLAFFTMSRGSRQTTSGTFTPSSSISFLSIDLHGPGFEQMPLGLPLWLQACLAQGPDFAAQFRFDRSKKRDLLS